MASLTWTVAAYGSTYALILRGFVPEVWMEVDFMFLEESDLSLRAKNIKGEH